MTHSITVDAREGGEIVTHPGPALDCREQVCRRHPTLNKLRPSAGPGQRPPLEGPGGGTPQRQDERDLWFSVLHYGVRPRDGARLMGMHRKRLIYLCEKWSRQGKYDYGVSCDLGWAVARMDRNPYITASSITAGAITATHGIPPPPPPPFSGASMAMRVVMAGQDTNPALREANRRAVQFVRRRAAADAQRIVVRDVRPAPRGTRQTPGVLFRDLVMSGQAFLAVDPARGGAVAHFTVHGDGAVVQNVWPDTLAGARQRRLAAQERYR